ncbi:unnamed protein product [Cylicocyclus nassatus]|uniref:Decapping nuclease n=1 Tax=Cylicocyclus nassatus TaxID=53992 RepID=A0AA36M2B7_CYLNA|nr:unnamed protein product [Cylicocyclus nassatus]
MSFDMDDSILVTIPIRYDDLPHAELGTPQKLGEYSKTRNKPLVPGRKNARYLYEAALDNEAKVEFDLNIGFDTFEDKEEKKLEVLLEWIVSQAPEKDSLKKVLHEADIVCRRGLLTRIAATPYTSRDWEFAAARVEDVIFLCEGEHYQLMKSMTPREQLMTYWGFKFEQYMTVKERNSSLLGIRDIVVGYRDDNGIVAKVDVVHTDDLRKRVGLEWKSNVCMNLLSDVLCSEENVLSTISINTKNYDQRSANFGQPLRIGEYTMTHDRRMVLGREDARYLYEAALAKGGRVRFDLNQGIETFEEKVCLVEEDYDLSILLTSFWAEQELDVLLEWIVAQAPNGGPLKKVLHEADFVSWRGLLTRIAATPFCPKDSWQFTAARVGGVIFLCEGDRYRRMEAMTPQEQMMTYWGFKFEHYMTVKEKYEKPKTDEAVTCLEEFAVVNRSTLTAGSERPLKLVYSGEVDAINAEGDIVELKTQRHALNNNFWKYKSLKWWLQSYLIGIRDIVVGFRDDNGIVTQVDLLHTDDLYERGGWSANVCMGVLFRVLSAIRSQLGRNGKACIVRYVQSDNKVTIHRAALADVDFFTSKFKTHFHLK